MADITMCRDEECALRYSCVRFMSRPSLWQSYFVESPRKDGECRHKWLYGKDTYMLQELLNI